MRLSQYSMHVYPMPHTGLYLHYCLLFITWWAATPGRELLIWSVDLHICWDNETENCTTQPNVRVATWHLWFATFRCHAKRRSFRAAIGNAYKQGVRVARCLFYGVSRWSNRWSSLAKICNKHSLIFCPLFCTLVFIERIYWWHVLPSQQVDSYHPHWFTGLCDNGGHDLDFWVTRACCEMHSTASTNYWHTVLHTRWNQPDIRAELTTHLYRRQFLHVYRHQHDTGWYNDPRRAVIHSTLDLTSLSSLPSSLLCI
jgi:hypothetical protein